MPSSAKINICTYHSDKGTSSNKDDIYDFCESDDESGKKLKTPSKWQQLFNEEVQRIKLRYAFLPINLVKEKAKKSIGKKAIYSRKRNVGEKKRAQRSLDFLEEPTDNFDRDRSAGPLHCVSRAQPHSKTATESKSVIPFPKPFPRHKMPPKPKPDASDDDDYAQPVEVLDAEEVTLPDTDEDPVRLLRSLGSPVPATEKVRNWLSKMNAGICSSILKSDGSSKIQRNRSFRVKFRDIDTRGLSKRESANKGHLEKVEMVTPAKICESVTSSEGDRCPYVTSVIRTESEFKQPLENVEEDPDSFEQPEVVGEIHPTDDSKGKDHLYMVTDIEPEPKSRSRAMLATEDALPHEHVVTKIAPTLEVVTVGGDGTNDYVPIRNVSVTSKAWQKSVGNREKVATKIKDHHLSGSGDCSWENVTRPVDGTPEIIEYQRLEHHSRTLSKSKTPFHDSSSGTRPEKVRRSTERLKKSPRSGQGLQLSVHNSSPHTSSSRKIAKQHKFLRGRDDKKPEEVNLEGVVRAATVNSSQLWSWLTGGSPLSLAISTDSSDAEKDIGSKQKVMTASLVQENVAKLDRPNSEPGSSGKEAQINVSAIPGVSTEPGCAVGLKDITNGSGLERPIIKSKEPSSAAMQTDDDRNYALCSLFPPANPIVKGGTIKRFLETKAQPETSLGEWDDVI